MGEFANAVKKQGGEASQYQVRYIPVMECGDAGVNGTISLAVRREKDKDDNLLDTIERDSEGVPFVFVQTGGRYTSRVPALAALIAAPVIEKLKLTDVESKIAEAGFAATVAEEQPQD